MGRETGVAREVAQWRESRPDRRLGRRAGWHTVRSGSQSRNEASRHSE